MLKASPKKLVALATAVITAFGVGAPAATGALVPPTANPFYAIDHDMIDLPEGVMPWSPNWTPDGKSIVFNDYNSGHGWIVDAESSAATCITCAMGDAPVIPGAFTYAFPDQKRLLVANELGDSVFILECETSLASCDKHTWLPVDLSGDGGPNLGRRTYHLAPDGIHLAYSNTRADGLIMMISTIQRQATDYKLVDYRVVNPPAPTGPLDGDINRWINGSTLSEFKSFADGGASMIFVTETASADVDMYKMDLKTGAYTRLTNDPDWDEDGAPAPDNSSVVAASWRTMDRLSKLGRFTPQPPFGNLPLGAGLAINYVSSRPGFACDLQPWLLDGTGDSKGRLGQPLLPYTGGDVIAGNNLSGVSFWSPDSTKVLLQERLLSAPAPAANDYVQQKGGAPNRLAIAKIARPATQPAPTVMTEVGAWATTPAQYKGSNAYPGVRVFPGSHGGTLTLTQAGDLVAGNTTMVYSRFSRDGITFLDGVEEVTGSPAATINYLVNLTATDALGKKTGSKTGALEFTTVPGAKPGQPPMTMTGDVTVDWAGKTTSGLPQLGACPESMPKQGALSVEAHPTTANGKTLFIKVTADVYGDIRPVQGATVQAGGKTAITDHNGTALLFTPQTQTTISATAGTFTPTTATVK